MNWVKREPIIPYDENDTIIEKLAKIRGITDIEEYLNPSADCLHSPYLLTNIEPACERIVKAINDNEKICISLDIDMDGIASGVSLFRYLSNFTDMVYFVHGQRDLGHGIETHMEKIHPNTDLLIIVDSSSNSVKECRELKNIGMDIIIFDHHQIEKVNPYALIVNPQKDDNYPNKSLSGSAVVYKAMQVLDDMLDVQLADAYIDLIACGLYADVMDMTVIENRYIVKTGLGNIKNLGLKAILDVSNVSKINGDTIGYIIAPMINGVARLNEIEKAIDLLLDDNYESCLDKALCLKEKNDERKKIEETYFKKIKKSINKDDKIIIIIEDTMESNFRGLIATRIANTYMKPTMVLKTNKENGTYDGSFRTYGNFNMKRFLETELPQVNFTIGHEGAGGVGFNINDLQTVKDIINSKIKDDQFGEAIYYDLELDCEEINEDLINQIETFNYIHGQDMPKFLVRNIFVCERKVIGKKKDTVKIVSENDFEMIKFKTTPEWKDNVVPFSTVEAVGSLNMNSFTTWRHETIVTKQMNLDDIKIA